MFSGPKSRRRCASLALAAGLSLKVAAAQQTAPAPDETIAVPITVRASDSAAQTASDEFRAAHARLHHRCSDRSCAGSGGLDSRSGGRNDADVDVSLVEWRQIQSRGQSTVERCQLSGATSGWTLKALVLPIDFALCQDNQVWTDRPA